MHANRSSRRVGVLCELGVPLNSFGCGTGNTWSSRYGFSVILATEVLVEEATEKVCFFAGGGIDRKAFRRVRERFIAHFLFGMLFEAIDPTIAHTI